MSSSQLCTLPKTGLSIFRRMLFVFSCATDLFFDSFCHCGSQRDGIHYPLGISTLAETEHDIKKSSTVITFLFAGTGILSHFRHFSVILTYPSIFTGKWLNMRFQPSHCSSVLLRSIGPDTQRERKRDRFQFMRGSLWRGLEKQYWASVKHE